MKKDNICNRDCLNCIYDDCIVNDISKEEKDMSKYRDIIFSNINTDIHKGRCNKFKLRQANKCNNSYY